MSGAPRLFLLLLRFLPRDFRDSHRAEMGDVMANYLANRSVVMRGLFWVRAAFDVILTGVMLRLGRGQRSVVMSRVSRGNVLDALLQDLRHALKSLRRDAGLAVFAVLIVGLGVGASTTVFSVVNALLLQPLPFDEPDRLVWISNGEWGRGQQLSSLSVQVVHVQDLRANSQYLEDVAGYSLFDRQGDHTLTGTGSPERLTRLRVTQNFFDLLGIAPLHGRLFTSEETTWGGPRAVLLDHGFWMRRFAGDPDMVGQSILLNGEPVTVAGILPRNFNFPATFAPDNPIDFVEPFPLSEETNRQGNTLALIGRLRPGATIGQAQSEASVIARRPKPPRTNTFQPHIVRLHDHISGGIKSTLFLLVASVALVMLIVCANLSNLLLARGTTREKEMAIRSALGGRRGRLMRQLMVESIVLSVSGAALGFVLATGLTHAVTRMDVNLPLLNQVQVDSTALAFTLLAALITGIVFGVVPAFRTSRTSLQSILRESGRGSTSGRARVGARDVLIVTEVALACILMIGAILMTRSLYHLVNVDLGFQPQRAVALRIDAGERPPTHELRVAYYSDVLNRLRSAPGIESVGITDVLPTAFNRRWGVPCTRETASGDSPEDCNISPFVRVVSEDYLHAMGLSLISGRDFSVSDNDTDANPVVIVNERLAQALWGEQEPLGKTLTAWGGRTRDWEVIGVVRGMRHLTPEQEPGPEMFFTFRQMPHGGAMHVIARGPRTLADLTSSVRAALTPLDGRVPLNAFVPIEEMIDRSLSPRRFVVTLLLAFATFAMFLASLGIYAVIAYSVNQRRQEIGICLALGASVRTLHNGVLAGALRRTAIGLAIGLAVSWVLGKSIQSLLFGVAASDPLTFGIVPLVLCAVALLAAYLPARRVTRLDPLTALRADI